MTADLSAWLRPAVRGDSPVSPAEVDLIIRSIMSEESEDLLYLTADGRFGAGGVLKGEVSALYQSKYLGAESRRRYREAVIGDLRREIAEMTADLSRLGQSLATLEEKRRVLAEEFRSFPGKDDLETAYAALRDGQLTLENKKKLVAEATARAETCYQQLKQTRDELRELTFKLQFPVNLEAFTDAAQRLEEYADALRDLETTHTKYLSNQDYLRSLQERLTEVEGDLDDLRADLCRVKQLIGREEEVIRHLQETLGRTDYQSIKAQSEACLARLEAIPHERETAAAEAQSGKDKAAETRGKLADLQRKMNFLRLKGEIHRDGLAEEYNLGYVALAVEQKSLLALAKKIKEEFKEVSRENKTRADYLSSLQERYFEVRSQLAEYSLTLNYLFNPVSAGEGDPAALAGNESEVSQWLITAGKEEPDPGAGSSVATRELTAEEEAELAKARADLKRLDLRGRIQGRDVKFPTLTSFLFDAIAENEKLLRESDRQLFEDILANTVSKKIRAKIYHSEQWVEKMNNLMAAMNTSSGLTFNLAWKSRAAETEEQIDTAELVGLLKSDANLLKLEDFQKLAAHFRSKINQARTALEEASVTKTFHTLIKEVLDYRQWFEFQLFYTKTGERKRELTNNAFDRFSGGEKAMAMYVPLFSAVYARYESARPDAPRLISLDEAFAGVDENNIRDMFRLLEELELNYVMNSQILWGDYDTVPALAICELVRPNNADFVSVIRYRWNGRIRELVTGELTAKEAPKGEASTKAAV